MITLSDYLMGRDVEYAKEITQQMLATAEVLLVHINDMLKTTGFEKRISLISGWRPLSLNRKVKGAAKNSSHITGEGIDITYVQELYQLLSTDGILEEFNLYMEDLKDSKNHIHLQIRPTKHRIFKA